MATRSGQKTVTTHGTAERIAGDLNSNGSIMVKALTTNTGLVYVGDVDGDVSSSNGMPLAAGDSIVFINVGNLDNLWLDSAVDGEGVAWILLDC